MKPMTAQIPTDETLCMMRAKIQKPICVIAAEVRLHPTYLGKIFSGKMPITEDLAVKLMKALQMDEQ